MAGLPETYVPGFHDPEVLKKVPYSPLGATGLSVSKLSLGTGGFSYLYGEYDLEECKKTVHEAIKNGVNYIDTAPFYGQGSSETALGYCLEGIPRQAYYIGTKLARYGAGLDFDFSAERTKKSIDESLQRLKLNYVDVIQVHDIEFADNLDIVVNETLPAVAEIVKSGKAKYIGVTGYPVAPLKEVIERSKVKIDTVLSYTRSTLIDRTLDDYLPFFKERKIGVINAAVNALGLLTNDGWPNWHPGHDNIKKVAKKAAEYCKQNGVELGKLAIYEGFQNKGPDTVLVGMKDRKILNYNLDVLRNGITPKEQEVLVQVKKILSELPPNSHWEGVEVAEYRKQQAEAKTMN